METKEQKLMPFEEFENLARPRFNVRKHALNEENAKQEAEDKAERPVRKSKPNKQKEAA